MKRKRKGKSTACGQLTLWFAMFAMVFGAVMMPVSTETVEAAKTEMQSTYISDVIALYSWEGGTTKAINNGYTIVEKDGEYYSLNKGVSTGTDQIYFAYKTTYDPSKAITNFSVWFSQGSDTTCPEDYEPVKEFTTGEKANFDANSHNLDWDCVNMYYTKDSTKGEPIASITFSNTTNGTIEKNYTLNTTKSGGTLTFLKATRRFSFTDNTQDVFFDGKPHSIGIAPNDSKLYIYSWNREESTWVKEIPTYTAVGDYETDWMVTSGGYSDYNATQGRTYFSIKDTYDYKNYVQLAEGLWLGAKNGVDGPVDGTDYTYSAQSGLQILSDKDMMLYNTDDVTMTCPITVKSGVSANLSLRNVQIVRSTQGAAISVNVAQGDNTTLTFYDTNTLTAKGAYAGIQKNGSGKLVIQGEGSVTATAGETAAFAAAGIGGGTGVSEVSNIEITGNVEVTATGSTPTGTSYASYGAAGIGSQYDTPASDIVISGGTVNATGGAGGAGIGSGANGNCDTIIIQGGTVTAQAGMDIRNGNCGAGIGSGAKITDDITATNIQIQGGTVTAKGSYGGAGIGSGKNANVDNIVISGGTISEASGLGGGAGIGSGANGNASNLSITGGTILAANGESGAAGVGSGENGAVSNLTISGAANVTAYGGDLEDAGGAGIGSGINGAVENISIHTTGTVKATAGTDGAGIGSGSSENSNTVTNIKIQNVGMITATGRGNGAGIGGGVNSSVTNIMIIGEEGGTDGILNATGDVTAIGAYNGNVDTIQILTDSKVVTSGAIGTGSSNTASNVTVIGDNIYGEAEDSDFPTFASLSDSLCIIRDLYQFKGQGSILKNCNVEAGSTMLLPTDAKVIIPEGITVTVEASDAEHDAATLGWEDGSDAQLSINGTLDVKGSMNMQSANGTLVLNGTLILADDVLVYGTFYNHGTVTGNGKVKQGNSQTDYEGTKAVYMNMDIDKGVTYSCKGTVVNNQVIISGDDLDNKSTGAYTISNIKAEAGYTISDILMNGTSVMDKVVSGDSGYSYTFNATEYLCAPGENTSVTFSIRTTAKVKGLVIDSQPDKRQYAVGTELDLTGLTVSKVFMSGKKEVLDLENTTLWEISGFDSNKSGRQTVTISYKGSDAYTENIAATFDVTVYDFGGINANTTYLKNGEDQISPTDIDDEQHVITFVLDENIGAIQELADDIKIQGNGWDTSVGDVLYDSYEGDGLYPTKAEYVVTVYLDSAKTISLDYKVVITQPRYVIDLNNETEAKVVIAGEYAYTGESIKPSTDQITVTDDEIAEAVEDKVVDSSYYTISYGENVTAGTGTVTITGNGVNAKGSVTKEFTIDKADLTAKQLAATTTYTLTNEAVKNLQLGVDEIPGLSAEDYTVSYEKTNDTASIINSLSESGQLVTKQGSTGTATVKMTVTVKDGATNYNAGAVNTTFTIDLIQFVKAESLTILSGGTELPWTEGEGDNEGYYSLEMYEANERTLTAQMQDGSTDSVTWTSENEDIATVDNGVITALKAGEATIVATTGGGDVVKSMKLTVLAKEVLTLTGTQSYTVAAGAESFTLDAAVGTEDLSEEQYDLTYVTGDSKVATVDADGKVSIVGEGTTTITVTATPLWTATAQYAAGQFEVTITVTHKLTKVDAVKETETTAGNIEYYACEACQKYFADAEGKTEITKESTVIPATGKQNEQPGTSEQPGTNEQPGTSEQPGTNEQPGASDQPDTTPQPASKGTKVTDSKGMTYKVTNADSAAPAVEFTAPKKSAKGTIKIADAVTINGVTYRVTSIGSNAFKNNKKITKVVIGKNVTTIGKNAFSGCTKLKTLTMGANVATISDKAFYKCTALTKVTIPAKVKKIGKSAFEGCKKLKSITIKTTKLTKKNVGNKAFKNIYAKATIKVPKSKVKAYTTLLKSKGVSKNAKIKK